MKKWEKKPENIPENDLRSGGRMRSKLQNMEQTRDHTIMKSRDLFGDKRRQRLHFAILIFAILVVTSFLIMKTVGDHTSIAQFEIGGVTFHFDNLLVLLM